MRILFVVHLTVLMALVPNFLKGVIASGITTVSSMALYVQVHHDRVVWVCSKFGGHFSYSISFSALFAAKNVSVRIV